jgi:hypothetical protein
MSAYKVGRDVLQLPRLAKQESRPGFYTSVVLGLTLGFLSGFLINANLDGAQAIEPERYVAGVQATPHVTPMPARVDTAEDDFIRRVHQLESSAGRSSNPDALHSRCKARGESNEYGYGGMANLWCYKTPQAAEERVRSWYRKHVERISEANIYCYYNLGLTTNDCDYHRKAMGL